MRRLLLLATVTLALVTFAQSAPLASAASIAPAPAAQVQAFAYFPETGHNIGLQIKQFYDANGGAVAFGPPLTELMVGSDGLQVQYFERARFEFNPDAAAGQQVVVSRAGALLTAGRTDQAFQWLAGSPDPGRAFFPESGHTLGGAFQWAWQTRGGLAAFGFPISEEFSEVGADGSARLVQYFERARFEHHPEKATPDDVQLSPLGRQLLAFDPLAQAATAPVPAIALLGQSSTGFNTSASERVTNISRATEMINGLVVPAGAEFSFAGVGDFSEANGFVDGYAIVGGRLEKVVGGGLCQVSTTLFRAVSNAGLQVTRRVGHSHIVYFYENILGFDATVFTPSVDFRWRNDSPGPIYIFGTVDRGSARMTFHLYGSSDGRQVRHEGPFVKNRTQPGVAVWQLDRSLPRGAVRQLVHGRGGADVTYNRIITLANGSTRTNTYFTRYTPWEDFYAYGPGVTPPAGVQVIAPRN